jgi:hypothetical protein
MNSSGLTRYTISSCAAVALLAGCGGSAAMQEQLVPPTSPAHTATLTSSTLTPYPILNGDFLGCPYPGGHVWQRNISSAPIARDSAANIQATIDAGGEGGFNAWAPTTDELVNVATFSTPLVAVQGKVNWHTPYSPWPWASNFFIEPLSDAHALVLQTQNCRYYEGDNVTYSSGVLSMYNGGQWDLANHFHRPLRGNISTASGIPLGLLAVRPEELAAGVISHALGWDGVAHSWSQTACVSPAARSDCTDDIQYDGPASDTPMPYGAHIRLKASFDDSSFPNEARIVAEALKNYGAYAYDTGCCNDIDFVDDSHGAPVWTQADSAALASITLSDFDEIVAP